MLTPRQGPALTIPSGNGELFAGGIKRFGPLLGDGVLSCEEGVGAGGGGIKDSSLSGGRGSGVLVGVGTGVGAGKGVCFGMGEGVVFGMGAYTGSFIGLGNGTFEFNGAGLGKPGDGMIMLELGGIVCVSTDGALRR